MLVGGLVGFFAGLALATVQDSEWPTALWRASLAACAAGFLTRWWGGVWAKGLKEVLLARQAEAAAAKAQAQKSKN